MARHSMKGGAGSRDYSSTKPGKVSTGVSGSPSLKNVGTGMGGSGDSNTRYSSTKPSGSTGTKGPAQPLKGVGAKDNFSGNSTIGPRVYKSTKPSK